MAAVPLTLDVREDLRLGKEPFSRIMAAVAQLEPGQGLLLYATFEPTPLFEVMARKGFDHTARQIDGGDWEVRFEPRP